LGIYGYGCVYNPAEFGEKICVEYPEGIFDGFGKKEMKLFQQKSDIEIDDCVILEYVGRQA
jgi:hypothetical protein